MQHRRDVILNQPALIPIAGNFDRKPRTLDRDVTTIGRARGTDLCLEANEISTLHCIVYRCPDGYRIRDCNSRCGTRINGESVKNGLLRDADIVNLGPFSFEFRLPPELFPRDGAKLDPVQVEHWKESRRRLALRALKLRKRVGGGMSGKEQEWAQKANLLKDKIRCYDQRLSELEGAEEELTLERNQLAKEAESHKTRVQQVEAELARRLREVETEIRQRWQEFQQRCKAEEAKANAVQAPAAPDGLVALMRQENEDLSRHLHGLEQQLSRQQEQLQREHQEFTAMKEQWVRAQTKSSAALEEQQSSMTEQENHLRSQKAELMRMMGEVRKMQEELRKQQRPDVRSLQDELDKARRDNEELRALVQRLEQKNSAPVVNDDVRRQFDDLHAEIQLLSEELQAKEKAVADLQHAPADTVDSAALVEENNRLKKQVEDLTKAKASAPKNANDLDRYEAELNDFRRQLESDRTKLNKEVEMLRERNKELDEAVREMEMEMSKERAELARERMRLDRVREEVKADSERLQREMAVRDSMAPVQKLRDELTQKQPGGKVAEKSINDRLRGVRNQLNDTVS
ncbi:MAG TPA: FHA domain-containing protein [Gemmataceae bacterium]|nr:FHA domain-containing protein [Gemmataceae bacterium]